MVAGGSGAAVATAAQLRREATLSDRSRKLEGFGVLLNWRYLGRSISMKFERRLAARSLACSRFWDRG